VAGSEAALKTDTGDLWDSGKVMSDETIGAVYAGKPLPSGQPCFWKVKVWDAHGKESAWSEPALWSVGLLQPTDWQAQWIGCDKLRQIELPEAQFEGAQWIWSTGVAQTNPPLSERAFLATVSLPPVSEVAEAELLIAADDTFSVNLNGQRVGLSDLAEAGEPLKAYRFNPLPFLQDGKNEIRAMVNNAVAGSAGLILKLTVTTKSGEKITRITDASWLAAGKSAAATNCNAWSDCRVLGEHGMAPWGKLKAVSTITPPASYLRTGFKIDKPVVRATLYGSALGWFDLHLNGKRVSDDYFHSGWTDYEKRVYYRTYDVTSLVRTGDNALGAILSDGWYSGYIGWARKREHYGNQPRVLAQLVLEFSDGSRKVVATGPDWKAGTGPITGADILQGETYDAREEITGWDQPGFNDKSWASVNAGANFNPVVQAHPAPPVVAVKEFRAKTITEPKPGVYVLDLGQNFAGVPRLTVHGKLGQKITLRHAERLAPDGGIYTINLRSANATDVYICKGDGVEVWSPRFTFHGFQYIEITGLTEKPDQDTVVGVALSSDTPVTGSFECSDPMLNQLHNNIYWTQRANFIDIPTDCPQRDERMGWTGDAQVYIRTATLNTDVQSFFTKWLVDLDDGQRADGQFPMVAPVKVAGDDGGPAWADAGVIGPWTIYEVYNDRRLLEQHYPAMTRFIKFCQARSTPGLLPPAEYHCFGDWLSINADTPKDVIYTAYFAYSTRLTARAAAVLGHTDDAVSYLALFERIKVAFNRAYVGIGGRIKGNTQAVYVLALAFDLVDGDSKRLAARYLVEDIQARGGHLSTGFIGTKDLMLVLAKIGRYDTAYQLLHNDTFPSWGFSIKHGATSIWERWDGWTPEKGFQDPGMNSFAHYSFGAVYQWMVENIGGIRSDGPGYERIVIAPHPGGRLTSAETVYRSLHGSIRTAWKKEDGTFSLDVSVPVNTTATVFLPGASLATIRESGRPIEKTAGVKFLRNEGTAAVLSLGSGTYRFQLPDAR